MIKKILKKSLPIIIGLTLCVPAAFAIGMPILPGDADSAEMTEYFKNYIKSNYKFDVTEKELDEGIYSGIFESIDKHSVYYTKEDFDVLKTSLAGDYVGIGVYIMEEEGYLRITKPIPGGPAIKAGIKEDDVIVEVNGEDIKEMSDYEAISKIKGVEGTMVKIGIRRPGVPELLEFELMRERIVIKSVEYEIVDGNIGYLKITGFKNDVSYDVKEALIDFKLKNVKGIVIDLRDNPGGLLDEVIDIADYFLPINKEICTIDYKTATDQTYNTKNDGLDIPISVLINRNSASASEILAGALQQNNAATIIGETSYGKGTVQEVINLLSGDGFKLTVAEYKVANDTKINDIGVTPDIEVINSTELEREQFNNLVGFLEDNDEYKAGEYGLNVLALQQRLNILGYEVKENGVLDKFTISEIKVFQEEQNLNITSTLNIETENRVEDLIRGKYKNANSDAQLIRAKEILFK